MEPTDTLIMPQRVQDLIIDFFQISLAYLVAIFISLQRFSAEFYILGEFVKYLSFAIAGGYTAWKWYNEFSLTKKKKK